MIQDCPGSIKKTKLELTVMLEKDIYLSSSDSSIEWEVDFHKLRYVQGSSSSDAVCHDELPKNHRNGTLTIYSLYGLLK